MAWGLSPTIEAPTSTMAASDSRLSDEPGFVPADDTATVSPASRRMSAAAICDFPPFFTQTNSTDGRFDISSPLDVSTIIDKQLNAIHGRLSIRSVRWGYVDPPRSDR